MNHSGRWTCTLTGISVWAVIGLAGLLQAQGFPVPRAEPEFRKLLPFVHGWAQQNAGDEELFKRWSLLFGPLSIQVTKANHGEASSLKNLYLGVSGAAFKVDPRVLANSFHCGPSCVEYRRADLKAKIPRIEPRISTRPVEQEMPSNNCVQRTGAAPCEWAQRSSLALRGPGR